MQQNKKPFTQGNFKAASLFIFPLYFSVAVQCLNGRAHFTKMPHVSHLISSDFFPAQREAEERDHRSRHLFLNSLTPRVCVAVKTSLILVSASSLGLAGYLFFCQRFDFTSLGGASTVSTTSFTPCQNYYSSEHRTLISFLARSLEPHCIVAIVLRVVSTHAARA